MRHLVFHGDNDGSPHAGDTIVFLHGGNVAGWMWGEQIPAFPDHHILVPDLPGFGASNDEPWVSVAHAADRVAELIASTARGGVAHVVGLSLGAGVALQLALRHPTTVSSLLLASASITPPSRAAILGGRVMLAAWNRPWFWAALARGYKLPADSVEIFTETGLGIRQETARAIFDETCRGFDPAELAAAVPALGVRVLAVAGGRDSRAISVDSLAVLAAIDGVETAIAPGMHHQWNIENVALFNATVREWIGRSTLADGLVNSESGTGEQSGRE
ncbi:alpha/beta fold hydrolase [Conyzicola sp.]|uniref:alpha/beta fold hydrolase n=1 Tax=Conyzicola sp. TaxID=1969404 RepID=UPI003988C641